MDELTRLRKRIDKADEGIVRLLAQRRDAARAIARVKEREGLPVRDAEREREVLANVRTAAKARGLDPAAAAKAFTALIATTREDEERVLRKRK